MLDTLLVVHFVNTIIFLLLQSMKNNRLQHLKRFRWQPPLPPKVESLVTFRDELDMAPYLDASARATLASSSQYRLIGVVNHHGKACGSGHYTAVCRDVQAPENWLEFNDRVVRRVHFDDVVSSRVSAHSRIVLVLFHEPIIIPSLLLLARLFICRRTYCSINASTPVYR